MSYVVVTNIVLKTDSMGSVDGDAPLLCVVDG